MERDTGFEPATSSLGSWHGDVVSPNVCSSKTLPEDMRCTKCCTNPPEIPNETDKIQGIREALAGLSRDDLMALLVDALTGKNAGNE